MRTKYEIQAMIDKLSLDKRLSRPLAVVKINAPLALIQLELETKLSTLRWILSEKEEKGG